MVNIVIHIFLIFNRMRKEEGLIRCQVPCKSHPSDIPHIVRDIALASLRERTQGFLFYSSNKSLSPAPKLSKENRTLLQPIRTLAEIDISIKIPINQITPLYQAASTKVKELQRLGMSIREIAMRLNINQKTVVKALKN